MQHPTQTAPKKMQVVRNLALLGLMPIALEAPLIWATTWATTPPSTASTRGTASNSSNGGYVAVGEAKKAKSVISLKVAGAPKQVDSTLRSGLEFLNLFRFAEAGLPNIDFALELTSRSLPADRWELLGTAKDTRKNQLLISKKYTGHTKDLEWMTRTFASDFVTALTGRTPILLSKIAMTCEQKGAKEIFVMNFDGSLVKQVTHSRSMSISPAWSPDGARLAYSVIARNSRNIKVWQLREIDFATGRDRLIYDRIGGGTPGMASGAAYSPDGKKIALTLSKTGNPEIHLLDRVTGLPQQITKTFGESVDPSWNRDGSKIAFTSTRSGLPMIYTMGKMGQDVRRITFTGQLNSSPSWAPGPAQRTLGSSSLQGAGSSAQDRLVFASWVDRGFDLFTINADGTQLERLTKREGSNEDPQFSPDGEWIAFSSNRHGTRNIYVMTPDQESVRRLTYGLGNCSAPKWSLPLSKQND